MSQWLNIMAKPLEPVVLPPGALQPVSVPAPEYWQLRVQKLAAPDVDGVSILVEWRYQEGTWVGQFSIPRITQAQSPVGTVLHTFLDVGPMGGRVVVEIDRFGGLQGFLHYPTLPTRYQLNWL